MNLPEFFDALIEAALYGGIATENPTKDTLNKFQEKLVWLKRDCGCYVTDDAEYRRKMPRYNEVEGTYPMEHAETGRLALREVAPCCLKAILGELLFE